MKIHIGVYIQILVNIGLAKFGELAKFVDFTKVGDRPPPDEMGACWQLVFLFTWMTLVSDRLLKEFFNAASIASDHVAFRDVGDDLPCENTTQLSVDLSIF